MAELELEDGVRYLLGELAEADAERFEEAIFADPAKVEEVEAIEAELYERYLDGALEPQRRAAFEARFLATPEGRARLARTRAIDRRFGAPPTASDTTHATEEQRAAASAMTVAGSGERDLGASVGPLAAATAPGTEASPDARPSPSAQVIPFARRARAVVLAIAAVVLAVLGATLLRSPGEERLAFPLRPVLRAEGGAPALELTRGTRKVALELALEDETAAGPFTAAITRGGVEVARVPAIPSADRTIAVAEPDRALLEPGRYEVTLLSANEPLAYYGFRVP